MQNFLNFVAKYKEYISVLALIVISLSLVSMGEVSRIGGMRTVVVGSIGWMQSLFSFIPRPGALQSENRALRELNLQLSSEVTKMRNAVIENKKLRELVAFKEKSEYPVAVAEIVGRNIIEMRHYITLDHGKSDSLDVGMAVRTDAGLVGMIIGVTDNFSLVELIENRDIKITAKVQRSRLDGILTWEGGEVFELRNIPKSYDVKIGDIIQTSEYNNKYPSNIPIGQVVEIREEPGNIFITIAVKPFASFSTMEQVFVIKHLPNPERTALVKQIDELLRARKGIFKNK